MIAKLEGEVRKKKGSSSEAKRPSEIPTGCRTPNQKTKASKPSQPKLATISARFSPSPFMASHFFMCMSVYLQIEIYVSGLRVRLVFFFKGLGA